MVGDDTQGIGRGLLSVPLPRPTSGRVNHRVRCRSCVGRGVVAVMASIAPARDLGDGLERAITPHTARRLFGGLGRRQPACPEAPRRWLCGRV